MSIAVPPSLVSAVVAADDDDAARFVLADWLCDRGDPHGRWLMSWLDRSDRWPERSSLAEVHRRLFAGWPRQHAVVTWRMGFVRELVVRLPGVTEAQLVRVLRHPTLWLCEALTFTAAQLPLFELGVFESTVAGVVKAGPHARLRRVHFAGLGVEPDRLVGASDALRAQAPRLITVTASPHVDERDTEWLLRVDRLDVGTDDSSPGPFSPAPGLQGLPLDPVDEEALWLEHGDYCDLRDDEPLEPAVVLSWPPWSDAPEP